MVNISIGCKVLDGEDITVIVGDGVYIGVRVESSSFGGLGSFISVTVMAGISSVGKLAVESDNGVIVCLVGEIVLRCS